MREQEATLCYILTEGRVLLIRKKRGIGAGKVNGPGGKVEPGETPLAAAVRETEEETGVTPLDPQPRGEMRFEFADGLTLRCHIYLAHACQGEPRETPEATPFWCPVNSLPYGEMWEDDHAWLPLLLAGKRFEGAVTVAGEAVTGQNIRTIEND